MCVYFVCVCVRVHSCMYMYICVYDCGRPCMAICIHTYAHTHICTGPGQVVGLSKAETIRSHTDLHKGACPWYDDAVTFYTDLASRADPGWMSVDLYACDLDQVRVCGCMFVRLSVGSLSVGMHMCMYMCSCTVMC